MGESVNLEVKFNSKILVDNREYHNSPTDTLKTDFINALLGTDSTPLTMIDRIVLVDTAGAERDSATLTSADWTVDTVNRRISTSKAITATASYTFNRVRLKSGTKTYFEASVESRSVSSGTVVNVSVVITMSITWSVLAQPPGASTVVRSGVLELNTLRRLAGVTANITLHRASWGMVYPTQLVGQFGLTKSIAERRAYHDARNFTSSGSLRYVFVENTTPEVVIEIDFGTTYTVTTSDTCSINIVFGI